MTVEPINIASKLASFDDAWNPRVIAECNAQHVRAAKLRGAFVWHAHEHEDELFMVIEGTLAMHLRATAGDATSERTETVQAGEMIVIPAGVEHKPEAIPEGSTCSVLIFEPAGVVNTGTATGSPDASDLTRDTLDRL